MKTRRSIIILLYPYVRDKRNFNKVIDILFSNAYKDEMRKFIEEYHQNNK